MLDGGDERRGLDLEISESERFRLIAILILFISSSIDDYVLRVQVVKYN